MPTTWVTSDLHFGHPFMAKLRGFATTAAHDTHLLSGLTRRVLPGDDLYVEGDFALAAWREALAAFAVVPGRKHLILGNHDRAHPMNSNGHTYQREYLAVFDTVSTVAALRYNGTKVLLSHFPYDGEGAGRADRPDRASQYRLRDEGAILLHGHVHDDVRFRLSAAGSPMVHVGLDAWELGPVTLHDALAVIPPGRPRG